MRRKRTSKRRWKARCKLGREIPMQAIVDYRLEQWFVFIRARMSDYCDFYLAVPR